MTGPDEHAPAVATYQGQRLAQYAAVVGKAAARVPSPPGGRVPESFPGHV